MKQLYSNVAICGTTVHSKADNPNMKKDDLSKIHCRNMYRIVLKGQTEEQTDKPKNLHALLTEGSDLRRFEPWHEISNNVVCATSKASDQPEHTRSLIRAFASRLSILGMLSY